MHSYHYTRSGFDNIWLANGFTARDTSYSEVSIEDVDGLHDAIERASEEGHPDTELLFRKVEEGWETCLTAMSCRRS